jgi:hypothetical protein
MTSAAKIRANRRNALRSTGPRSFAGMTIAARNSRRHGLTLPVLDDPSLSTEVIAVARAIETSTTGREADAAGHVLACRIAEAMIDLKRVRLAKLPLVTALHADACDFRALMRLSRLDRYERHALARRKRAIREFTPVAAAAVARAAAARHDKTKPTEKGQ